jgi:AraC family transcriptional regulator
VDDMQRNPPGHVYGRAVRSLRSHGVHIIDAVFAPATRTPVHAHEQAMICAIADGSYLERCCARSIERTAGTVFLHPAGDEHVSDFRGAVKLLRIDVDQSVAGPLTLRAAAVRGGAAASLAAQIRNELRRCDEETSLAVEGLALELIAALSRQQRDSATDDPPWLRRVREVINDRFSEKLTLEVLGQEAGIHPVHLAAAFRKRTGSTVAATLRGVRVDYARRQLVESDRPIADIALDAGFSSQSHLTTAFRRMTGLTPDALRRIGRTNRAQSGFER